MNGAFLELGLRKEEQRAQRGGYVACRLSAPRARFTNTDPFPQHRLLEVLPESCFSGIRYRDLDSTTQSQTLSPWHE